MTRQDAINRLYAASRTLSENRNGGPDGLAGDAKARQAVTETYRCPPPYSPWAGSVPMTEELNTAQSTWADDYDAAELAEG